jgi:putative transposase
MARKITIKEHETNEVIEQEIKRTQNGRYRLRLQAIYLVLQKHSSKTIQTQLMISKPTLFRWINWYNEKGIKGLKEVSKGGRSEGNPKWDDTMFTALFAKLDKMEEYWSVPKMQAWIVNTYNVTVPERTIHHRLKVNGYSYKSNRPNPYKGDPNLQATFKKVG